MLYFLRREYPPIMTVRMGAKTLESFGRAVHACARKANAFPGEVYESESSARDCVVCPRIGSHHGPSQSATGTAEGNDGPRYSRSRGGRKQSPTYLDRNPERRRDHQRT